MIAVGPWLNKWQDEGGRSTYFLVSLFVVSSLSLELSFYVECRDNTSFSGAMDPNDLTPISTTSPGTKKRLTPKELIELCDEIHRFPAFDDGKDIG